MGQVIVQVFGNSLKCCFSDTFWVDQASQLFFFVAHPLFELCDCTCFLSVFKGTSWIRGSSPSLNRPR